MASRLPVGASASLQCGRFRSSASCAKGKPRSHAAHRGSEGGARSAGHASACWPSARASERALESRAACTATRAHCCTAAASSRRDAPPEVPAAGAGAPSSPLSPPAAGEGSDSPLLSSRTVAQLSCSPTRRRCAGCSSCSYRQPWPCNTSS
eukprot:scaffold140200_cov30-Tisochrysis_lutea.AAC.2